MVKRRKYKLIALILFVIFAITTNIVNAQIQDPGGLGGNGIGQSGGPFDPAPTDPSGVGSGGLDPVTDPGGPILPPGDVNDVPIDGGISILIAVGLATGYKNSRRQKKYNIYKKD